KYPFKAYVTIMNGCNNFCTYCIVPYTRGREVSRRPEKIVNEIKDLVDSGCLEVTLLGQNVNSYGRDLGMNVNFASLLRILNEIEGLERIRFMTSHPKDLTDDVITAIAEGDKICKSIHLPIQSGSTRILKKMNRKYSKDDIFSLVDRIKKSIPGVAITTDIIVGFPGETEEDFTETLDVLRTCKFDSAFTFIYSMRSGTPAAKMPDQVSREISQRRLNECLAVLHNISHKLNLSYQDAVLPVLMEEPSKTNIERMSGRTDSGKLVNFKGNPIDIGKIVTVKITEPKTFSLNGIQIP
ncbi:MAG: tRNA (N6-isopentenyl adenosine(37)-C2)-methylthiotransferase MiaB, partial [Mangrovibacterium sp.]|nr:tRNA (N6-isopentenyl adenosine(37)-C2)-methylthiotransferase MiaB [Mangrovibacterium sp.]